MLKDFRGAAEGNDDEVLASAGDDDSAVRENW
jgi:hypothetical protein